MIFERYLILINSLLLCYAKFSQNQLAREINSPKIGFIQKKRPVPYMPFPAIGPSVRMMEDKPKVLPIEAPAVRDFKKNRALPISHIRSHDESNIKYQDEPIMETKSYKISNTATQIPNSYYVDEDDSMNSNSPNLASGGNLVTENPSMNWNSPSEVSGGNLISEDPSMYWNSPHEVSYKRPNRHYHGHSTHQGPRQHHFQSGFRNLGYNSQRLQTPKTHRYISKDLPYVSSISLQEYPRAEPLDEFLYDDQMQNYALGPQNTMYESGYPCYPQNYPCQQLSYAGNPYYQGYGYPCNTIGQQYSLCGSGYYPYLYKRVLKDNRIVRN